MILEPYCPHNCGALLNLRNLHMNESTDITKEGVKVIVCHKCHKQVKVTTKLVPSFIFEKAEKPSFWKKIKKWPVLSALHDWFGRPSRLV